MSHKTKAGFTNSRYNYALQVIRTCIHDNGERSATFAYVTEVSYSPKFCRWEAGKKAMYFDHNQALDLQLGLMVNGYVVNIVEVPDFVELENKVLEPVEPPKKDE